MTLKEESYLGVPILDPGGEVVGHLSVIHDAALEDAEFKTAVLDKVEAAVARREEAELPVTATIPTQAQGQQAGNRHYEHTH